MAFDKDIKKHLSAYKAKHFSEYKNGVWTRNGKETPLYYAFKTPLKDEEHPDSDLNLIGSYKNKFLDYEKGLKGKCKIKRHMYFHHMNSSQAMCFNFFYPLMFEKKLELITDFLGQKNELINYESVCFEKISKIESEAGRRPTNFDFYFETVSCKKFYFEIKYTEYEFGKAPMDDNHIDKFKTLYINHANVLKPEFQEMTAFLKHYQILRNLIHIGDNSYVVFLYPEKNIKIKEGADKAENTFLIPDFKNHFFNMHWDDMYAFVKQRTDKNDNLKTQFEIFWEKYLNINNH